MQKRTIAMIAVVGCAVTMLTGCGVPQEEYDAKLGELNTAWQEIETLKGKNADTQSLLDAEKAKVRTARIEMDDASERIKTSQAKETETASALAAEKSKVSRLESSLTAEKARTMSAQEATDEVEMELAEAQEEIKLLLKRWKQLEDNLNTLDGTVGPDTSAPAAGDKSALDLLNEMGAE